MQIKGKSVFNEKGEKVVTFKDYSLRILIESPQKAISVKEPLVLERIRDDILKIVLEEFNNGSIVVEGTDVKFFVLERLNLTEVDFERFVELIENKDLSVFGNDKFVNMLVEVFDCEESGGFQNGWQGYMSDGMDNQIAEILEKYK